MSFQIENHSSCNYDYLEIRDGREPTAPLLGEKRCGSTSPDEIGEFVKQQQCKKATRVCKLNSFSDKTQRWKLDGEMLINKEGVWTSNDNWKFTIQSIPYKVYHVKRQQEYANLILFQILKNGN